MKPLQWMTLISLVLGVHVSASARPASHPTSRKSSGIVEDVVGSVVCRLPDGTSRVLAPLQSLDPGFQLTLSEQSSCCVQFNNGVRYRIWTQNTPGQAILKSDDRLRFIGCRRQVLLPLPAVLSTLSAPEFLRLGWISRGSMTGHGRPDWGMSPRMGVRDPPDRLAFTWQPLEGQSELYVRTWDERGGLRIRLVPGQASAFLASRDMKRGMMYYWEIQRGNSDEYPSSRAAFRILTAHEASALSDVEHGLRKEANAMTGSIASTVALALCYDRLALYSDASVWYGRSLGKRRNDDKLVNRVAILKTK